MKQEILATPNPTAGIARAIKQENASSNEVLIRFFDTNPGFDLGTAGIDTYLAHNPEALENIAADEKPTLIRQLHRLQRLFWLTEDTPDQYAAMRRLIDDGLDSAQAIASMEVEAFCSRYQENPGCIENPRMVHAKASQRAATAMALFAKYSPQYNSVEVAAIGQNAPTRAAQEALEQDSPTTANGNNASGNDGTGGDGTAIPDWEKLFGSLNRCQCEHCRSVLSPSAYLVDLFKLLEELKLTKPGKADESKTRKALDVLLQRRPDIAEIGLSCANTHTTLPYVDLVLEVLENAVFPQAVRELGFKITEKLEIFEKEFNAGIVSKELCAKFQNNDWPLSEKAKVRCKRDSEWWIADEGWQYNVKDPGLGQFVVTVSPHWDTTGTAADLAAHPEHLNVDVYNALKLEVYPWVVPFDLLSQEARVYLAHLGVPRHQLMELLLKSEEKESVIACEYIGITQTEKVLLTDAEPKAPWKVWGEDKTGKDEDSWLAKLKKIPYFLGRSGLSYVQLIDLLKTKYINPDQKIKVNFPYLDSPEVRVTTSPCDYAKATIEWPIDDEEVLYKVHCFLRLQRKTGWSILELDKVLKALGYARHPFDDALLVGLQHIRELQNDLKVPLEELLSWFSHVDTAPGVDDGPSLYERLFLNRSVQSSEIKNFRLNEARTELSENKETILKADNSAPIVGALGINSKDLALLVQAVLSDPEEVELTLENLSRLYRSASLARALRLSIQDFVSLRTMTGIHPDDPEQADPTKKAVRFVAAARQVESAGIGIEELDYLLRHQVRPQSSIALDDKQIALLMDEIRAGLKAIHDEEPSKAEAANAQVVTQLLRLNWDGDVIGRLIKLLKKEPKNLNEVDKDLLGKWLRAFEMPECEVELPSLPEPFKFPEELEELEKKVSFDAERNILRFRGWMSDSEKMALTAWTGDEGTIEALYESIESFAPASDAALFLDQKKMTATKLLAEPIESRFQTLLKALIPYVRQVSSEQLVKQKLAEALNLDARMIDDLLTERLKVPLRDVKKKPKKGGTTKPNVAIIPFLHPAFAEQAGIVTSTPASFPDQFNTFRLLHKVAILIERFGIEPAQLEWLFDNSVFARGLDLNALPVSLPDAPAKDLFAKFSGLVDLFTVRNRIGANALARLLGLAKQVTCGVSHEMWEATGWDSKDIDRVAKELGLKENAKLKTWDGPGLRRFQDCFAAIGRLGVPAERALEWVKPDVSYETAQAIKQAARAKYEEKQWLAAARPLRDALREKQRVTLVAYLLARKELEDPHSLYQHYLIDVEMAPCMMTSRTKLAISSVQLFIQRLLMNLDDWRITQNQAAFCKKQWQWLKNYRVWEANRKVFLYPENWIEPDLRKDKTPFFKDLETELMQADVTAESAERAFRNYLQQLGDVSRLEICGMFHEQEIPTRDGEAACVDVLHVFARTPNTPRVYYYRRRADDTWTPWEKVNVAVDGDHLIPVVFNRRLYLFWPIIAEQTTALEDAEGEVQKTKDGAQKTWEYWEIQLAFSEYRQDMWSAKTVKEEKLNIDPSGEPVGDTQKRPRDPKEKSAFTFKTVVEAESLTILCAKRESNNTYPYIGGFRITNDERIETLAKESLPPETSIGIVSVPFEGGCYAGMAVRPRVSTSPWALRVDGVELFNRSSPGANIICSHQLPQEHWLQSFFYQDGDRTLFVSSTDSRKYRIENFYHPAVSDFKKRLNRGGIQELLARPAQARQHETLLFRLGSWAEDHFPTSDQPDGGEPKRVEEIFFEEGTRKKALEDRKLPKGDVSFGPSAKRSPMQWAIESSEQPVSGSCVPVTFSTAGGTGQRIEKTSEIDSQINFKKNGSSWTCFARSEDGGINVFQNFEQQYKPDQVTIEGYNPASEMAGKGLPVGEVDFRTDGAYSQYNWELFFHAPLLLADRLSKNQRFEEAQEWFHHIFDPTDISGHESPRRYWKVLPFFEEAGRDPIIDLMQLLHYDGTDPEFTKRKEELKRNIDQSRRTPFEPHLIARLRTGAYQKTVVMKYIDNLIAWADQLFRQDTIESINEATQLYVLAAEILGKRPLSIAPQQYPETHAFDRLKATGLDEFHNAMIALEAAGEGAEAGTTVVSGKDDSPPDRSLKLPYFCVPGNDKLLSYWDTVGDRLFKIRHCQNIEGVERALRLFEPPIEPALLVRAAAAGVNIGSALRDANAPLPYYRFSVMLKKAIEFCNDVRGLGGAYLSALEKKDAEGLAELKMRQAGADLRAIKELQIEEAKKAVEVLTQTEASAQKREEYYKLRTHGLAAYKGIIAALGATEKSFKSIAQSASFGAAFAAAFPDAETYLAGFTTGLSTKVSGGGKISEQFKSNAEAWKTAAEITGTVAEGVKFISEIALARAENDHQIDLIDIEKGKLAIQKDIAKSRITILEKELRNLKVQARNAAEVDDYLRRRFTNLELYNWRVSQLSALYFQSYQMAYDLAKRAERAFRYELGESDTNYIRFGYWDSLKKGLLAGEQLYFDLKRMEKAYLEKNRRGYEITKHISLAMDHSDDFNILKEKGTCYPKLNESLFDRDYPGHYMRRIKSVSLTIDSEKELPPHTNVNCSLTLLKNSVRMSSDTTGGYKCNEKEDLRFREEIGAVQSIVTSSGKDDSGLFRLNFEDDRYLPFEGAGAISEWQIELSNDRNPSLGPLSDVLLHIHYTALDGGEALKMAVAEAIRQSNESAPEGSNAPGGG